MTLKNIFIPICFSALVFMSCAGVSGNVFAGRNALQTGRANDAIGYLTQAADADPNYRIPYRVQSGVLAYLGRHTSRPAETWKLVKLWKERSISTRTIRWRISTLGSRC